MLTEVLDKVKTLARGRRAAVLTDYRSAVEAVASGKPTNAEKVAGILDAAQVSPDQFEADVTAFAERVRLAAVVAKQADAEKKLVTAKAKIDQLEKKLEEAVSAIKDEAAPHHEQVRKAEADMAAARQAEDELRRSYPQDGPARAELAEAQRRASTADAKRRELGEMIARAEGTIRTATADPAHYAKDTVPLAEARLADYRGQLAEADAEMRAAVEAMEAASAKMVQP